MQIFAKDFTKEWVEYPFNPIALASTAIAKELIFCNAIANAQCERNLSSYNAHMGSEKQGFDRHKHFNLL